MSSHGPPSVQGRWRGPGNIFQFLGHIFADPAQAPAAIGTGIGAGRQLHLHPGDVIRDRTALGFVLRLDVRQFQPRGHRGGGDLAGPKRQLQLLCRPGRGHEPLGAVPGQLVTQPLPSQ